MKKAAALLLAVGLISMTGDLLRFPALKGIGAATSASPAPRVFSAVNGYETYSTRFALEWKELSAHEVAETRVIDSRAYSRLKGPYNRRNIYGAALAYGPVLASDPRTRPMLEAVLDFALCGDAPIVLELFPDRTPSEKHPDVRYFPRDGTEIRDLPLTIEPSCRSSERH